MPNISLTPDPPVHDQGVLICLNGATMPAKVTVTLAGETPVEIEVVKYCVTYHVPKGTTGSGINFHDETGQCPDESRLIA